MDLEIFENDEILSKYEQIKDKLSKEEFLEKMEEFQKEYKDISFYSETDFANMVVSLYQTEDIEKTENQEGKEQKINNLTIGEQRITITAKIMGISNIKKFTSRKGNEGKLCNVNIADDTGSIKVTFWTDNIKLLNNVNEGDVVQITNAEARDGYRGIELQLQPRSQLKKLDSEEYPQFPEYIETITLIKDIEADTEVNIIARIKRLQNIREYVSNGKKGKVTSIELQDETGKINYTLWNRDIDLIQDMELKEGDAVKILKAQSSERNGEISLSHRESRIIKGDFNLPEFKETILKLADAHEENDVTILGVVTKIQDKIIFKRQDGTDGQVKSIEITDDTGKIRVTLWGNDTDIEFNKGDIVKIAGGNIQFDDYSQSGYSLNTNWNSQITINPECDEELKNNLKEIESNIKPLTIDEIQEIEDDGEEVDVIGMLMDVSDIREFQREDATEGQVRSTDFADTTGMIRVSFWDEKAKLNLEVGKTLRLENVRTRLGMHEVELNVGKSSRVIELTEEETKDLPTFTELEDKNYEQMKINELDEDDERIKVIARILDIGEIREYQSERGSGKFRTMDLADDTGSIRATLWEPKTDIGDLSVGSPIKIKNPNVNFREAENRIELSIGNGTTIQTPTEDEISYLPDLKELEDKIYELKNISNLEEGNINVRVKGQLTDINSDSLIIARCPSCGRTINGTDESLECDNCGADISNPNYLIRLSANMVDDTGEIQITFFNEMVEELLEIPQEEIIAIFNEGEDLGMIDGKIEDLANLQLDIIADVRFDVNNDSENLNPRKILSKQY